MSRLDQWLKAMLEKATGRERQPDWDVFEEKLMQSENEKFDDFVKEELDHVQVPHEGAWERFEDQHAEEIGLEHPVDEVVKSGLSKIPYKLRSQGWEVLAGLLGVHERRERNTFIKKSLELLLVIVFSWTIVPYLLPDQSADPTHEEQHSSSKFDIATTPGFVDPSSPKDKEHSHPVSPLEPENETAVNFSANDQMPGINAPVRAPSQVTGSSSPDDEIGESSNINSPIAIAENFDHGNVLPTLPSSELEFSLFPAKWNDESKGENGRARFGSVSIWTLSPSASSQIHFPYHYRALSSVALIPVGTAAWKEDMNLKGPPNPEILKLKDRSVRRSITLISGPQLHFIKTPHDPVYDHRGVIQDETGVNVGVEFEHQVSEISVGGHLSTTRLKYQPPPITEIYGGSLADGYNAIQLEEIEYQLLSANLFLRQLFPLSARLYGIAHLAGGLQMAVETKYNVREEVLRESSPSGEVSPMPAEPATGNAPLLFKKSFHPGLAQGGHFNENSFMLMEIGSGVLYKFQPKVAAMGLMTYSFTPFSDGLGPNRDQVSTFSFRLGLRYYWD